MSRPPRHEKVRQSYDAVAEDYATRFVDELAHKPLDRALLAALAEQTEAGTPIADIGCGPGHVAAWLAGRGVSTVGIDLSQEMIAVGRRTYPQVEFREGDLVSLPAADAEFGSLIAFYSIIHLETPELGVAFSEMHRVLRPAGRLLVAFHAGTEARHVTDWHGHQVELDFLFFEPGTLRDALDGAGFEVEAQLERTPYPEEGDTRRAYLLARRRG